MRTAKTFPIFLCLVLTFLDIFIVEIFYRPTEAWSEIWKYHYFYWSLIVILPLIVAVKTKTLYPFAVWIFFQFGLEDTLFYWLQLKNPPIYWGVTILTVFEPTWNLVLFFNVVGLIFIILFYKFVGKLMKRKS